MCLEFSQVNNSLLRRYITVDSSPLIIPFPLKTTPLFRQDFRCTKILKYNVPLSCHPLIKPFVHCRRNWPYKRGTNYLYHVSKHCSIFNMQGWIIEACCVQVDETSDFTSKYLIIPFLQDKLIHSSFSVIGPLPFKATPLIRPNFRWSVIVKYY